MILRAAKHLVEANRITECAMDSELGFKGLRCPVTNCYMNDSETNKCLALEPGEAKASSKAMRDVITIVEIIDAARNAPAWVTETKYKANLDARLRDFVKEAGITPSQLQYVLDNNQLYATILAGALRKSDG